MRKSTVAARWGALAIAAGLVTVSPVARAAPPGPDTVALNVVAIEGNDVEDQAEALTKALRNNVRSMPGWSLTGGDHSMEVLVLSLKCTDPPDAACQNKIGDDIKVERYIWGYLKKRGPNVVGELALWVRGKGSTRTPLEYSANLTEPNDDALKRVAKEALERLLGGPPKGGLHVRAGTGDGQIFLDGEAVGKLVNGEATLQVPSGEHTLTVKVEGFQDAQTRTTVRPNASVDAQLTLERLPPKTPMNGRAVAGWVFVGVGVASLAAGAVTGVVQLGAKHSAESNGSDYKAVEDFSKRPDNVTTCDYANGTLNPGNPLPGLTKDQITGARSVCSKNATFTTMQIILYPAGAVLGGVGIYLLATAHSSKPAETTTGWTMQPYVGPSGGKLDATYRF